MQEFSTESLNDLLATVRELQELLTESPQILHLVQILDSLDTKRLVGVAKADRLLTAEEVATMLHISRGTVYNYVDEGILEPVYTPLSKRMKFWVSDVRAVTRKETL